MFSTFFKTGLTWRILVAVKDTYLLAIALLCLGLAALLGYLVLSSFLFGGMDTYWRQLTTIAVLVLVSVLCLTFISEGAAHMHEYFRFRGMGYPPNAWVLSALLSIICAIITTIAWLAPSNFMSYSSLLGPIPVAPWHGGEFQLTFFSALGIIGLIATSTLGLVTWKRVAIEYESYWTGSAASF